MEVTKMAENEENTKIRYCKKCGCELASTNKHDLCDNCRRERASNIRKGVLGTLGTLGSIALFVITQGKHDDGKKV